MSLAEYTPPPTSSRKPKHKAKAKAKVKARRVRSRTRKQIVAGQFAWGAAEIGTVIGRNASQTFHLIYSGALDGAVHKVNGQHVGDVPKLISGNWNGE